MGFSRGGVFKNVQHQTILFVHVWDFSLSFISKWMHTDLFEGAEESLGVLGVHLEAVVSIPPRHVVQVGPVLVTTFIYPIRGPEKDLIFNKIFPHYLTWKLTPRCQLQRSLHFPVLSGVLFLSNNSPRGRSKKSRETVSSNRWTLG